MLYGYDGGSGFWGNYVYVINGKSHDCFSIDDEDCICNLIRIIPIPYVLLTKENKPFLKALEKQLFLENKSEKRMPDASLEWLITAYRNNKKVNGVFIDKVFNVPIKWYQGETELSGKYYFPIETNLFLDLFNEYPPKPNWLDKEKKNYGWLIYHGNCNSELKLEDKNETLKVFNTTNGIVIKHNNQYSWVFVNDYHLTGGSEKCPYAIQYAKIYDNYIIFSRLYKAMSTFFIIDTKSGFVGRLRYFLSADSDFKINDKFLTYDDPDSDNIMKIDLSKIINELNNIKDTLDIKIKI